MRCCTLVAFCSLNAQTRLRPYRSFGCATEDTMQHATYSMQHAAYDMQHTTCNMQQAAYDMQHTTRLRPCRSFGRRSHAARQALPQTAFTPPLTARRGLFSSSSHTPQSMPCLCAKRPATQLCRGPTGASARNCAAPPCLSGAAALRAYRSLAAQVALASAAAEPSGQRKVFTFASADFVRAIKTR